MSLCAASLVLAVVIMMSSFHLGRPGRRLAFLAAIIGLISLLLAWRIARFVEDTNAVRSDTRQVVVSARRVEGELKQLSVAMGASGEGSAEDMIRSLIARRAEQDLAEQNRDAMPSGDEEPVWARPDPLSRAQVIERLNRIYVAKLAGEGVAAEDVQAPTAWLNEQLGHYGFAWRIPPVAVPSAQAAAK